MTSTPTTTKTWIAWILAFLLIQPAAMYLLLRVLHWNFFLSAFLAAALAVGGARLMLAALRKRGE